MLRTNPAHCANTPNDLCLCHPYTIHILKPLELTSVYYIFLGIGPLVPPEYISFLGRSPLFAPPLWQLEWEKVKIRITTNGPMCANESCRCRDYSTCGAYISDRHSSLHWFQLATAASADNLPLLKTKAKMVGWFQFLNANSFSTKKKTAK